MERQMSMTSPDAREALKHWWTPDEIRQLEENGRRSAAGEHVDPVPPALLVQRDGRGRWLLTEIDPEHPDLAYGLCDAGIGLPECGTVSLSDLWAAPGAARMRPEREESYQAAAALPLSRLERMASEAGQIIF